MGVYDADKHDRENTHPRRGKQVAYLVFCKYASSVPRSEWERCVVLQELFLSWLYRTENKGVSYMGKTGLAVL